MIRVVFQYESCKWNTKNNVEKPCPKTPALRLPITKVKDQDARGIFRGTGCILSIF